MGSRYAECSAHALRIAKDRRAMLSKAGLCINGKTHGRATHGCRCHHCYDVHHKVKPSEATPFVRITVEEADEIIRLSQLAEVTAGAVAAPLRRTA